MSQEVNFPVNLAVGGAVGSRLIVAEPCPMDGKITGIKIHWPNGCNGLVQVAVYLGPKQICPYKGFLNLNDATVPYDINEPCRQKDNIRVDFWNGDGANTHRCTVTVTVKGNGE